MTRPGRLLAALIACAIGACAETGPAERPPAAAVQTAAIVPPPPAKPPVIARYDCDGAVLHPSLEGASESPLRFDFQVYPDYAVTGILDGIGPPLSLSGGRLAGRLWPERDGAGRMIAGHLQLGWPHLKGDVPADFRIMRETFVAAGQTVDGVGRIRRRTSAHAYLTARVALADARLGAGRAVFIEATCAPLLELPPG